MRIGSEHHLAYCTNIHRGETWAETLAALERYTLAVKREVCPDGPYAIGLRLGQPAAAELSAGGGELDAFRRWLDRNGCYVFTINGFPYGPFHGTRVKEQVYRPDWTTPERLAYTNQLFDILAALVPPGIEGSVSTLPGSFKAFAPVEEGERESFTAAILENLRACGEHIERLSESSGRDLHLGLEPEPLGLFETSAETVAFLQRLREAFPGDAHLARRVGVNYDTCHLAVEFEEPAAALDRFAAGGVRLSKLHLSSALALEPNPAALGRLAAFAEDTYLHQVVMRQGDGSLRRIVDLPEALATAAGHPGEIGEEWRVHFHIPLHTAPDAVFGDTRDHLRGVLQALGRDPGRCTHLEMETYTWEVLPEGLRATDVVDQLTREYEYCLGELGDAGLMP